MGRLRNARVNYRPVMQWATNPMFSHGIMHWIKDFYLDNEGIPIPEKSNIERYFVIQNGKPLWYDNEKEARELHGDAIRSFRAIRAHVTDNKPLLKNNPDYYNNLLALPEIKKRIFLHGSWFAREEEAGLFLRSMISRVDYPNLKATKRVRCWDLASQPVSTQSPNPDWTRGVLASKDKDSIYTIEDAVSVRDRPHIVEKLILDTARQDREKYGEVTYGYPVDPGQAGIARANEMKRKLAEIGVSCRLIRPNKSKRTRFLPFSAIAEAGFVSVVMDDWNDEFFNELEEFTGLRSHERDDFVDCCSDTVFLLNQTYELPSMNLSDVPLSSSSSTFGFNGVSTSDLNFHSNSSIPTSGLL